MRGAMKGRRWQFSFSFYHEKKRWWFVFLLFMETVFSKNGFCEAGKELQVLRWSRSGSIRSYLEAHQNEERPLTEITFPAVTYDRYAPEADLKKVTEFQGKRDVLLWQGEGSWVEWQFSVPRGGLYYLSLDYFPLPAKGMEIELAVYLDGQLPYDDLGTVRLPRVWKDAGEIQRDDLGNDLRPGQIEEPVWSQRILTDTQGFYNKKLPLFVSAGPHRIRLELRREALALSRIGLSNPPEPPDYATYLTSVQAPPAPGQHTRASSSSSLLIKIQAERPFRKSDSTLSATYDRSSAATEPMDPAKIRLNTIGGSWSWKLPGQWIEWKVVIPEDGWYYFFAKGRQNFQRGMAATRIVSIDGVVPYKELENLEFPYSLKWQMVYPRDEKGEPCLIYLTKGEHTVRMEASLGRLSPILTAVDDLTYEVNTLRRRFIMIMGAEPDLYRDYQLEKEIPGLLDVLQDLSRRFTEQADEFERITGQRGSEAATLRRIASQLAEFAKHPEYIPHRQGSFRDNIANLASWILYRKEVPLELDYLGFAPAGTSLPPAMPSFWAQFKMSVQSFFASFFEDYTSIGKKQQGNVITVWIASGRDQAQILRDLIINDFTPKTGIKVNLSLVQGSLIEATLAGRGPEIAINTSRGQPINLAARNALYDLSSFPDFPEIARRFAETALVPYTYRGKVYALPLTQDFHVLFYRKDIFAELGIAPPETWDDVYRILPILQRNNMQMGLPYQATDALDLIDAGMGARNIFPTLLLQNGGTFYTQDFTKTALTEAPAYAAFKQWIDFYAAYGFTLKYDFYSRFRTGEMPIGIASYGMYNLFMAAAPEIRNAWEIRPIPGKRQADGSINRSEAGSGSAVIMFKHIKNPGAGWEFLKWWTSAEVQLEYARRTETILGPAARLNTANLETFEQMPWAKKEAEVIKTQWAHVKEVPEIPGGYYTIRMLDTAFSLAYYNNENPRAVLYKYADMINEELARKRKELGLDHE